MNRVLTEDRPIRFAAKHLNRGSTDKVLPWRLDKPHVIWFTGLSGSGKTTLAQRVFEKLKSQQMKVEYLDGDEVRTVMPQTGFKKEDRQNHIRWIGFLASRFEKSGSHVIASFISPYLEDREFARRLCVNYFEIYVSTPLEVCERRDVKGLYALARGGKIQNFTGVSDPYEAPITPELVIDTSVLSEDAAVDTIVEALGQIKARP